MSKHASNHLFLEFPLVQISFALKIKLVQFYRWACMKKLRDAYKFITILLQASINVDRCNSSHPSFINLTVERFHLFMLDTLIANPTQTSDFFSSK